MRRAPDIVALVAGAGAICFGAVLLADSAGAVDLTFAWLAPLVCAVLGAILLASGLSRRD
ncbi:MAG: hypothetical protein ABI950_03630 [Solirubrobacteraceae bacterium]